MLEKGMLEKEMLDRTQKQYKRKPITTKLTVLPTVGQVFKSYKEFCEYLHIPVLDGDSKKHQTNELTQYMSWERDGNAYIIDEVFVQVAPQPQSSQTQLIPPRRLASSRGKNKPLTNYQYLFNTLLLNQLAFGERDENNPDCISFTKTQLRQNLFKLINKNYYDIRGNIKKAISETGLSEELLKFGDRKITDKIMSMSFRGFNELKNLGDIDISNEIYIYYIDLNEYFTKSGEGDETVCKIRSRVATPPERTLLVTAGIIGREEYQLEYAGMDYEDKMNPENHREKRSQKILRNKLKILNGVEYIEDVMDKILYEAEGIEDRMIVEAKMRINEGEWFEEEIQKLVDETGKKIVPTQELLNYLKVSDGLNGYAIGKGEFWINAVEKICFYVPKANTLKLLVAKRYSKLATMPGAQLELNKYMLDWIEEKATNVWGGFTQKFLVESATGSKDIGGDMKKFADKYVNVKNESGGDGYEWKKYVDEHGKAWEVRYSSNKMQFNRNNLDAFKRENGKSMNGGNSGDSDGDDSGDSGSVILWGVPRRSDSDVYTNLCTNCNELISLAEKTWEEIDGMPISGYLGGVRDKNGEEGECLIMELGELGIMVLKGRWRAYLR